MHGNWLDTTADIVDESMGGMYSIPCDNGLFARLLM